MTICSVDATTVGNCGGGQLVTAAWVRRARALLRWSSVTLSKRSGVAFATVLQAQLDEGWRQLDRIELLRIGAALERAGIVFPDRPASDDIALKSKSYPRVVDHLHTLAHRPDILRSLPTEWRLSVVEDGLRVEDAAGREAGSIIASGRQTVTKPPVPLARVGRISLAEVKAWLLAASAVGRP